MVKKNGTNLASNNTKNEKNLVNIEDNKWKEYYKQLINNNNNNQSNTEINKINTLITFFSKREYSFFRRIKKEKEEEALFTGVKNMGEDEIKTNAKRITEFIEGKIIVTDNLNKNKWYNFYKLLGKKDTYNKLANIPYEKFSRDALLKAVTGSGAAEKDRDAEIKNHINDINKTLNKYLSVYKTIYDEALEILEEGLIEIADDMSKDKIRSTILSSFKNLISLNNNDLKKYLEDVNLLIMNQFLEDKKKKKDKLPKNIQNQIEKDLKENRVPIFGYRMNNNNNKLSSYIFLTLDLSTNKTTDAKGFYQLETEYKDITDNKKNNEEGKIKKASEDLFSKLINTFSSLIEAEKSKTDLQTEYPNEDEIKKILIDFSSKVKIDLSGYNLEQKEIKEFLKVKNALKLYIQYTNQGVSGILGEIRGAIIGRFAFGGIKTRIVGSETAASGSLAQDVFITATRYDNKESEKGSKKDKKENWGLQIKNYTSSDTNIILYDMEISLNREIALQRYLPKDYIENLQNFLIKYVPNNENNNENNNQIKQEDLNKSLLKQLYSHIHNFLRIAQGDLENSFNLFFLVNDIYYPASYILRLFILQFSKEETLQDAFLINNENKLKFINNDDITSKNVLSKNIISFKGVKIPISRLTEG